MNINTNTWNKIRYTIYTPGYDLIASYFNNSRKKSIDALGIKPRDKILIIGAGTGLDLKFLPIDCEITAIDITPSMIEKIKHRNKILQLNLKALVKDGQATEFKDQTFDIVILHLILAVIPDPVSCIQEAERVLKQGGKVAVFDKFVHKNQKVSQLRKSLNLITNLLFSDITRNFESIVNHSGFTVLSDMDADFHGNFRLIQLRKDN